MTTDVRVFNGIAELESAIGTHIGYSPWLEITQERIDLFAEATGDHQWIHVDPERAATGPFGSTIAHGFLTVSLAPMLSWQVYEVAGIKAGLNYGANKLRFPAAVRVGSRVRAGVELTSLTQTSAGYQLVATVTVELEGSDRPACVVESVSVLVP